MDGFKRDPLIGMARQSYCGETPDSAPMEVHGSPVAYYDYRDDAGNLLFQVIRYEPKAFRSRRVDGERGWRWGMEGQEPTLYCLPQVLRAHTVIVLEGEKDVHTALSLGLPEGWAATTSPFGAGQWRKTYSELLRGKEVFLCPDTDYFGQAHLRQMSFSLLGKASQIKIVRLPDTVKDLSEWVEQGGTAEKFMDLLKIAQICPYPISDEELKKNICHLHNVLGRVIGLRGVVFEWRDPLGQGGLTGPQHGFIAQEAEAVFPEWIGIDNEGYSTLNIMGFEALAIESMRELRAMANHLSSRLAQFQNSLNTLQQ